MTHDHVDPAGSDPTDRAVDEVLDQLFRRAGPERMNDAEAAEFYEQLAERCAARAARLRQQMHSGDTEAAAIEDTEPA